MASFVESTVKDIDNRLKELQDETARLTAAKDALLGEARRGPGRPRGSTNASPEAAPAPARKRTRATRSRGRRGGNTRSNQALELVKEKPGITIPQIAESLKIEPNYLYRVMPKLVSEGLIRRDGLGYHPAGQSTTPAAAPAPAPTPASAPAVTPAPASAPSYPLVSR